MEILFAPLEGLTDGIFRKIYHEYYGKVDAYYMPFFSPTMHRTLTAKEQRELPFADTLPFRCVPQIMSKNADDFLWAAEQCAQRGYTEVNLNAGCPSGTVVSKGKGAGMLANPESLMVFLEKVCAESPLPISVKTRIGVNDAQEFPKLLDIYNHFPLCKLIIHPRTRSMYYNGEVDYDAFSYAVQNSKNPICFNGNLGSKNDIERIKKKYLPITSVMVGRGFIRYPGMLTSDKNPVRLKQYHDKLLFTYIEEFKNERNAMFRMKEHWFYLLPGFLNSEKLGKRMRKATRIDDYRSITDEIFYSLVYSPEEKTPV